MEPATIPDQLRRHAISYPDAVALVVHGASTVTYGEWDRRSNSLAHGLVAAGIQRGDRVGLLFDNARWCDYAVAYVAVQKMGAVVVPLGPRFVGPELARALDHCGAFRFLGPDDLVATAGIQSHRWLGSLTELEVGRSDDFPATADASDLCEILYTSGTTGTPKGVACTHAGIVLDVPPAAPAGGRGPDASVPSMVLLHSFPIGTSSGQESLRLPLRWVARSVVLPRFDPERFCAAVAAHHVTHLAMVPTMAQVVVASGAPDRHDMSSVERVMLGSAPTTATLARALTSAFPGATILNAYTLTEAGSTRTLMAYDELRPNSVGRPVAESEVKVVDDDAAEVPAGDPGEVWLRRRGVPGRRYFGDSDATAATFVDGWVRTGDVGYLDDEGYLYLVDRKKDIIISGGFNISSVEVEQVLEEHPDVAEAAVFGLNDDVLGQKVVAAVVTRSITSARELQAFVRKSLAPDKTPQRIYFVDLLPRNASGKILKSKLREEYAGRSTGVEYVPPRTDVEEAVATIWGQVLKVENLGLDDDFFYHGGTSLDAVDVLSRAETVFGLTLELSSLFDAPTVAEWAAEVERVRNDGRESV